MVTNAKPTCIDFQRLVTNGYAPHELASFVRTSPYFDAQWYERQYPGIEYHDDGCPDAAFHYANYGYKEGKLPSPLFDGNRYSDYHNLSDYNPLVHYIASGCPGRYRSYEFGKNIVDRYNQDQTDFLVSERAYIYELLYKEKFNLELDLCAVPATLTEKFFSIKAFGADMIKEAIPLLDAKTMPETLINKYGFNKDEVINVKAICKDTDELLKALKDLPTSISMICNGMQGTVISAGNKEDLKIQDNVRVLDAIQANALGENIVDKLHPVAKVSPDFVVFDNPIFSNKAHRMVQVVCFNGKAQFMLITGPNGALTFADCDLNVLPVAISTNDQGLHPIEKEFRRPECLNAMLCKAETIAHDFKALTVMFAVSEKEFVCTAIRTELLNGMFKLSNDFDLRFGSRLELA